MSDHILIFSVLQNVMSIARVNNVYLFCLQVIDMIKNAMMPVSTSRPNYSHRETHSNIIVD